MPRTAPPAAFRLAKRASSRGWSGPTRSPSIPTSGCSSPTTSAGCS
jgi:hypothetical protein